MPDRNPDAIARQRIAFITQWYAPELGDGGVPRSIATGLRARGHDVQVLTGFPNYPDGKLYTGYRLKPYQRESRDGITIHRSPLYISHDTSASRRAANYVSFAATSSAVALSRVPKPDVSLVYSSPITVAAAAIAMKIIRGTPYVLLIQDMWPQSVTASGFLTGNQAERIEKALHRFCDYVYGHAAHIAVTSPGMIDLVTSRGICRRKIHFVPNWADESSYYPTTRDERLRAELGLTRQFVIMYAGNLGEVQGLETVLHAADILRNRENIQFAFVGKGSAENYLRNLAVARGLDNVTFIPPQPPSQMADILAAADAQLISLRDDPIFESTLPSKLQTLLAAGRPIVGCVSGDAARIILDAGVGVVATPGSAEELAVRTSELSELSPDTLAALGAAGRRYYDAHFSSVVGSARLESLLAAATADNGTHGATPGPHM